MTLTKEQCTPHEYLPETWVYAGNIETTTAVIVTGKQIGRAHV